MKSISFVFLAFLALVALAEKSCKYPEFKDKVVLVTGGSSGIGYQTALQFARCGAKTVIVARDSHPTWFNGSTAEDNINNDKDVKSAGGRARFVKADMSTKKGVAAVMDSIYDNEKDLHIAINNAAITGPVKTLEQVSQYLQTEHDSFQMNTYAVIRSTAGEIRLWKKLNHSGIIVNTASDDGLSGGSKLTLYAGSKSAIIGFTRSIAMQYMTGGNGLPQIRVNAIAPGFTDTSLVWQQCKLLDGSGYQSWEGEYINHDHPLWKQFGHYYADAQPAGKLCDPMDQAKMIMYLCSEEASYISGAVMIVDGGVNDEGVDVQ